MEGMKAKGREVKGLKKTISTKAKEAGTKYHLEGGNDMAYKMYSKLVYSKVREALGLDQCRTFFTGAAPMDKEVTSRESKVNKTLRILSLFIDFQLLPRVGYKNLELVRNE